mgnify:CR=1 FL=1
MSVIRVEKNKNYTCMSNYHLRDKNLTLKAKGLLSVILSLPDDWKYSIAGLAAICKEGTSAVKSALQELADAGYVTVIKLYPNQTETGRIEYVYDIHERPQALRKQGIENLEVVPQQVENQGQLNTKEPSTDKPSTKDKTKKGMGTRPTRFQKPTLEEVSAYCQERGNNIDPQYFIDYQEARGWKLKGGQQMRDWKATIRTWERNERRFNGGQGKRNNGNRQANEPMIGTIAEDNVTGKRKVYKGNGVWEEYVSDYVPQEGDYDIFV